MTWNLSLDILLVILILLFAPIGFMRGPVKELFVTLGVIFGVLLAEFWARPWGGDLHSYFDVGRDPGAFIVAMAFVMSVTFIGGYGLGLLVGPWEYSIPGRLTGGLISMLNGALLISFSLQYVRLFLLSDANEKSLEDSLVVSFLLDQVGWILLGAVIVAMPIMFYGLITRRRAYDAPLDPDLYDYEDEYEYEYEDDTDYSDAGVGYQEHVPNVDYQRADPASETRVYPPRIPMTRGDDESSSQYKADPEPVPARPTELTRPLAAQSGYAEERPGDSRPLEAVESSTPNMMSGDTDPELAVYSGSDEGGNSTPSEDPDAVDERPIETLPPGYRRCAHCHAVMPPNGGACAVCGQIS